MKWAPVGVIGSLVVIAGSIVWTTLSTERTSAPVPAPTERTQPTPPASAYSVGLRAGELEDMGINVPFEDPVELGAAQVLGSSIDSLFPVKLSEQDLHTVNHLDLAQVLIADADLEAAELGVVAARARLKAAVLARANAYVKLGVAAGKGKLGATLAVVPLVEYIVARRGIWQDRLRALQMYLPAVSSSYQEDIYQVSWRDR